MPIDVSCPGCKTKFRVSDKFAGQKGPCPKCKTVIQIPEKDADEPEIVIHAPDTAAGTKAAVPDKRIFQPIRRKETKVSAALWAGVAGGAAVAVALALAVRMASPAEGPLPGWVKLLAGLLAAGLGPPLAAAGYALFREAELEPFRGRELWLRAAICGCAYALLWGAYALFRGYVLADAELEMIHYLFLIPPFILVGAFAAFASFDLDYAVGALHYGVYLLATLALAAIAGLPLQ